VLQGRQQPAGTALDAMCWSFQSLFDISADSTGFVKFRNQCINLMHKQSGAGALSGRIMAKKTDVQNGIYLLLKHKGINQSARIQNLGA
jgi:hypothetical protein